MLVLNSPYQDMAIILLFSCFLFFLYFLRWKFPVFFSTNRHRSCCLYWRVSRLNSSWLGVIRIRTPITFLVGLIGDIKIAIEWKNKGTPDFLTSTSIASTIGLRRSLNSQMRKITSHIMAFWLSKSHLGLIEAHIISWNLSLNVKFERKRLAYANP